MTQQENNKKIITKYQLLKEKERVILKQKQK